MADDMKCKNCGNPLMRFKENNLEDFRIMLYCDYCGSERFYKADEKDYEGNVLKAYNDLTRMLKNKEYVHLEYIYRSFLELDMERPLDYRGKWGMVRCTTKEFTRMEYNEAFKNAFDAYVLTSGNIKSEILKKWNTYADEVNEHIRNDYKACVEKIDAENKKNQDDYDAEVKKVRKEISKIEKKRTIGCIIMVVYNIIAAIVLFPIILNKIYDNGEIAGVAIGCLILDWVLSLAVGAVSKSSFCSGFPLAFGIISTIVSISGMLKGDDGFFIGLMVVIFFGAIGFGLSAAAATSIPITRSFNVPLPQIPANAPIPISYPDKFHEMQKLPETVKTGF